MMERAPDHLIRIRALGPKRSFILEAPAGSGKTDLLTARFLALLAEVSSPRQILALTYTRKAADEMQARIMGVLRRARLGGEPRGEWDGLLLDLARKALANERFVPDLLQNPDAYRVGTFHSFCASVVRGWPLEACIPPGSQILEDLDQRAALEAGVASAIGSILKGDEPALSQALERRLASTDNRPAEIARQLADLLAQRDQLRLFERSCREGDGRLSARVEAILSDQAAAVLGPAKAYFDSRDDQWRELKRVLSENGATKAPAFPDRVPGVALADVPAWKGAAAVFIKKDGGCYSSLTAGTGHFQGMSKTPSGAFVTGVPSEAARALSEVACWPDPGRDPAGLTALADILALAGHAEATLSRWIPGEGLDYLELEMAALRALSWSDTPSDSLIFFSEHLRHLLVDEAQDMNDVQAAILSKLVEGWEPGDGRTAFVVGDPKQSIYRFRRADVALFTGLKSDGIRRESEAPLRLTPLELTANFRSRPSLVAFCNALFEAVMSDVNPDFDEVEFQSSEPALPESGPSRPVTAALFYDPRPGEGEEAAGGPTPRDREAAWVAGRVAEIHGRDPQATVALLFPARGALPPYLSALSRLGVPLKLVEGEDLPARPEARHLWNLFAALLRPFDDVAWAGALRAPWFRVGTDEILRLARAPGYISATILAEVDSDSPVTPFARKVKEALESFGREPYDVTVGRLWEALDGPAAVASFYGARGVADARAFLALLGSCTGLPAEEALDKLDRLMEKAYTPPDPRGAFSPISVMTVHKAKGLEFDHVFAVNLDRDPRSGGRGERPAFRLARFPTPGRPVLIASSADTRSGEENLAYKLLGDLEMKRGLAESKRLFYVAATRARQSLTLTGTASDTAKGLKARCDVSLLAMLWRAALEGQEVEATTRFKDLGFECLSNPEPGGGRISLPPPPVLVPAPPFEAQALPYRVTSPSALEEDTALAVSFGAGDETDPYARARGIVLHRIMETFARGQAQPADRSVAAALASEGLPADVARAHAVSLLAESRAAWDLPAFAALRAGAQRIMPEWALEDTDGGDWLRVGRIDLLIEKQEGFAVVDYKSGKPDTNGDASEWARAQTERYAPQLRAYAQMVSRWSRTEPASVRSFLLFTAAGLLVEA